MTQILNYLLSFVLIYGYPTIVGVVLLGDLGVPLPVTTILLAAGSFASIGIFNIFLLIPLVTFTVVLVDIIGYYLGRKIVSWESSRLTRRMKVADKILRSTESFMDRHGAMCVFLTRWLITPLGVPVNFIAGIHKYSFKKFLFWAIAGELLWSGLYIYLGYYFGANWQSIADYISKTPELLAAAIIGVGLIILGIRNHKFFS